MAGVIYFCVYWAYAEPNKLLVVCTNKNREFYAVFLKFYHGALSISILKYVRLNNKIKAIYITKYIYETNSG